MWLTFSSPPGQHEFGQKKKSPRRPVECEPLRFFGIVRVVGFKFPAASGFRRAEQNDAMIDGQRRKFHQMNDGQAIFFKRGGQCRSGARLVRAGKRENHTPVASQKIRAPRAAAFNLQKIFLRPAEFPQTCKAGNDNLFVGFAGNSWVAGNDGANELLIDFIGRNRPVRRKPRVVKKLPRHAREGEATMGVFRFRVARTQSPFARRRVHLVFPHQFVRKGEAVAREFETSPVGFA